MQCTTRGHQLEAQHVVTIYRQYCIASVFVALCCDPECRSQVGLGFDLIFHVNDRKMLFQGYTPWKIITRIIMGVFRGIILIGS